MRHVRAASHRVEFGWLIMPTTFMSWMIERGVKGPCLLANADYKRFNDIYGCRAMFRVNGAPAA
jgi:hypothetical protein